MNPDTPLEPVFNKPDNCYDFTTSCVPASLTLFGVANTAALQIINNGLTASAPPLNINTALTCAPGILNNQCCPVQTTTITIGAEFSAQVTKTPQNGANPDVYTFQLLLQMQGIITVGACLPTICPYPPQLPPITIDNTHDYTGLTIHFNILQSLASICGLSS